MASQDVYMALEILVGLACCLGNLLVVWAVWRNRSLRKPTFCFVVSLAAADFLVGAVAIPLAILVKREVTSFYGCLFCTCVMLVLTQSSVLSLLAIATYRYLCVHIPLRYKRMVSQQRSWVAVATCWLLACVLGFTPLLGWHKPMTEKQYGYRFMDVMDMSYLIYFRFFGCILAPLVVMALLYARVFWTIHKRLQESAASGSEHGTYYLKERNLALSLGLVLALYAVCWLPLHIMNCISYYGGEDLTFDVGVLLSYVNSAANPLVYAFRIRKFQKAYLEIWKQYFLSRGKEGPQGEQSGDNLGSACPTSTNQSDRMVRGTM
ncbi:adenosine receptor A3-like [Anguilla anguilla]|uniref:adenosine receptor A3-like n=1 Tax=Anguilla anguilla TaxID=7936 RepID=UPI0015B246E7|nr:adenosine receptor A3-like [Anguilla anguilla]